MFLAGSVGFGFEVVVAGNDVGNIVFGNRVALVVERESIGLHVVEPNLVGASGIGLGEDEDSGRNACVGLEHARRHGDDGLQTLVIDYLLADSQVPRTGTEEHAIGYNGSASATHLKHANEQRHEEEFRFLGLGNGQERLAHGIVIEASGKGRIGQAEGIFVLVGIVGRKAVLVLYIGIVHAVKHQVHGTDTEHGRVGIEPMEQAVLVVVGMRLLQQLLLVVFLHVLGTLYNEACRTHSGVADAVFEGRLHEVYHHLDDVAWRAELAVVARSSHLAEDVFVHIAHGIAVVHIEGIDAIDNLGQRTRVLNEEGGIGHESAIG